MQHFLSGFQGNVAADQLGVGDDPVKSAFELAHVGGDLVAEKLGDLARNFNAHLLGLGLQNAEPQFVGRGVDVGDQAAVEPGLETFFHAFQVGGALIGRNDDLAALIDQGVKGMEKLLLGGVLAADELNVVDHQDVDGTELFLEVDGVLLAQRPDEPVHELFRRHIDDGA